ncbi:uncharacterized protein LOC143483969 isoform X2 [Brachyhypopomus gauderio]|uniref:uncharacterized protein LOC143483969 isoform X2 n=1 Tax=Brachyhypopomus gauderio TaxID=698409 RepID=UPI0040411C8C
MYCHQQSRKTFLYLAATLSLSLRNIGSATDVNWSIQEEIDVQNQTTSKEGTSSLAEASWPWRHQSRGRIEEVADENMYRPHTTPDWLETRVSVYCSETAMTLTAKGRGHTNLLVERGDATPVSVLHVPSYCGFFVRATWKDLVLIAPYDGCYILHENGSYILPLLWWGRPVRVSCPITPVSTPASLPGFCSHFGMVIEMRGAVGALKKSSVRVYGEWVPLVSDMCASHMGLPPEDLLIISFTALCAMDGSSLMVLLDGRVFTLTCQPSPTLFSLPLLVLPVPFGSAQKAPVQHPHRSIPLYYMPPVPDTQALIPQSTTTPIGITTTPMTSKAATTKGTFPPVQPPTGLHPPHRHTLYPISPFFYSYNYSHYPQAPFPPVQPTVEYPTLRIPIPKPTPRPQMINPSKHLPWLPRVAGFPEAPGASPKMSLPSFTCSRDHFVVLLSSAKMESIKVKDVKTNVWVPVISTPASCKYSLLNEDTWVGLFSPLPACHTRALSPSMLSLSLKFWDRTLRRHRTVQLQCSHASPRVLIPATTAPPAPWIWPEATLKSKSKASPSRVSKPTAKPSQSRKPLAPPPLSEKPPALSKIRVHSSQLAKHILNSWPSEHTLLHEITPLPPQVDAPQVKCYSQNMSVTLPPGSITALIVHTPSSSIKDQMKPVALDTTTSQCGYMVNEDQLGYINVLLPYTSCHMVHQDDQYKIVLEYQIADGHTVEALLSCQDPTSKECSLPTEQQLPCGLGSPSALECHNLGCCYSSDTANCYYPMDECTADHHFVFSIPASLTDPPLSDPPLTDPPLSPAFLVAAGNTSCTPQRVVGDAALFKIPLEGCGVHRYVVGNTVIYMLEILNTLQSLSVNYGTITRDSPFRLLVECRYLPGAMVTVGYLVKSPSLLPSIQAQGVFGVQLRIAKDQQYSSYYPQFHRPLRKLLGKPLYLEVRLLNPPDPSMVLLVHYCVAYPRSAHSAWILIHDGCPNPLDVTASHVPPPPPHETVANHVKRFTISTFQFLKSNSGHSEPGGLEEDQEEESQ